MTTKDNGGVLFDGTEIGRFDRFLRAKRPELGRRQECFLMWATRFVKFCICHRLV